MSAEDEQRERSLRAEGLRRREEMLRLSEARQQQLDADRERREAAIREQDRQNAAQREDLCKQQKKDLAERLRLMEEQKKRAAVFKQTERLKLEQRRKAEEKRRRDRYEEALNERTGRSPEQLTARPNVGSGARRSRLDPTLGALPSSRGRGTSKASRSFSGTGCLVILAPAFGGAIWIAFSWLR